MNSPVMDQSYQSYGGLDRPLFGETNKKVDIKFIIKFKQLVLSFDSAVTLNVKSLINLVSNQ